MSGEPERLSKLCLASFLLGLSIPAGCGISSVSFSYYGVIGGSLYAGVAALAAVLCGHAGRRAVRRSSEQLGGAGFALAGLLIGYPLVLIGALGLGFGWLAFSSIGSSLDDGALVEIDQGAGIELLLEDGDPAAVSGGELIVFPKGEYCTFEYEHLDWRHEFPGFERTALTTAEARDVLRALQEGDVRLVPRISDSLNEQEKQQRQAFLRRFDNSKGGVRGCGLIGGVLFALVSGEAVFASLHVAESGTTVFNSFYDGPGSSRSDIKGISQSAGSYLRPLFERAAVGEIAVLFPELSAEEALEEGQDAFGRIYCRAMEYVVSTPEVRDAVGEPTEIRPAHGPSRAAAWMDYSASFFARVAGPKGQAVVRVNIINSERRLEMVYKGVITEIAQRHFDWNGPGQQGKTAAGCNPLS